MFGGCVESGSGGFLAALGRTYVQTGEAWALNLSTFRFACYLATGFTAWLMYCLPVCTDLQMSCSLSIPGLYCYLPPDCTA